MGFNSRHSYKRLSLGFALTPDTLKKTLLKKYTPPIVLFLLAMGFNSMHSYKNTLKKVYSTHSAVSLTYALTPDTLKKGSFLGLCASTPATLIKAHHTHKAVSLGYALTTDTLKKGSFSRPQQKVLGQVLPKKPKILQSWARCL
eukprot:Em0005g1495a